MMEVLWCAVSVALVVVTLAALLDAGTLHKKSKRKQPNIVLFLVDDVSLMQAS